MTQFKTPADCFSQIDSCNYENQAGVLTMNAGYIALKEMCNGGGYLVNTVDTPDESFARALNITEQRETEIDQLMDKCHAETGTYPDAIAAISKELTNANELAYACFHLGAFAESQRSKHKLLYKLLGE